VPMSSDFAKSTVEQREAAYWDGIARSMTDEMLASIPQAVGKADGRRLALIGDLPDKHVLDVGCGAGEWAVRFALQGAIVEAIDISPEMVAATKRRAALLGVADKINAHVMSAAHLEYADGTFDVAHGQDIVHHLDPGSFGAEVARVLKVGGRAVFRENSGNNVLLMTARDTLCGRFGISKWSSDDEYPLTPKRLRAFAGHFAHVHVEYPEFIMFHYIDAKFFRYRVRAVTAVIRKIDQLVGATPLRRFSYRQLISCTR
jgi:SAM-dependent methyltransferase